MIKTFDFVAVLHCQVEKYMRDINYLVEGNLFCPTFKAGFALAGGRLMGLNVFTNSVVGAVIRALEYFRKSKKM